MEINFNFIRLNFLLKQHYREWLDSPLPFLNHKTPREVAKTKKGLQTVIDLLKDMENGDMRAVKQGNRAAGSYNFDWLYSELGVERRLLFYKGRTYQIYEKSPKRLMLKNQLPKVIFGATSLMIGNIIANDEITAS